MLKEIDIYGISVIQTSAKPIEWDDDSTLI